MKINFLNIRIDKFIKFIKLDNIFIFTKILFRQFKAPFHIYYIID
jgi:hypothetical protein